MKYTIVYTKLADRFLNKHEDVRDDFEDAIKELLSGTHPEKVVFKSNPECSRCKPDKY